MILGLIALQIFIAVLVVFILIKLLERELFSALIEELRKFQSSGEGAAVRDVEVVTARKLSPHQEQELRAAINGAFPSAEIVILESGKISGGFVLKFGTTLMDKTIGAHLAKLVSFE
ncbi:MAG: F0F1 ATP synthase subunit delta [Candidatus Omnitrophica bacterium]|nr:F0F1 ATP synthase subunit delta [Candidatus Omnitrophota bacterium]